MSKHGVLSEPDSLLSWILKNNVNEDAYITVEDAFAYYQKNKLSFRKFEEDLDTLLACGKVYQDKGRLYPPFVWICEERTACFLAWILPNNTLACPAGSNGSVSADNNIILTAEQNTAVHMALTHRISIITGGAGTGKTTLIKEIVKNFRPGECILVSPTGKAARNLEERAGYRAKTIHKALNICAEDKTINCEVWKKTALIIVDEAGMLSIELFAQLLHKMRKDCRLVLLGDLNQLPPVSTGNVLEDLLGLPIPRVRLQENFRQKGGETALYKNVVGFPHIYDAKELRYDNSFVFCPMNTEFIKDALVNIAVKYHQAGVNVQVLSPYKERSAVSVYALNNELQARLNPAAPRKKELKTTAGIFRDGDRVVITKNRTNDRGEMVCVNGDVGTLCIVDDNFDHPRYCVRLDDGRCPSWDGWEGLNDILLAYAMTVHKSQGSQYDVVLFPIVEEFSRMLYRNLFYTAISRAKKQVILFGSEKAISTAIKTPTKLRKTALIEKTATVLEKRQQTA